MSLCDYLMDTPERQLENKRKQVSKLEQDLGLQIGDSISPENGSLNYPAQMQLLKQYKDELLALPNINTESQLAFLSEYDALLNAYNQFKHIGFQTANNPCLG